MDIFGACIKVVVKENKFSRYCVLCSKVKHLMQAAPPTALLYLPDLDQAMCMRAEANGSSWGQPVTRELGVGQTLCVF